MKPLHWHIFCRVIDNFGDIGVCWRLARQLYQNHGQRLTLWVDDLASFKAIYPEAHLEFSSQHLAGIHVLHWQDVLSEEQLQTLTSANVIVEAFGCDLPEPVISLMQVMIKQPLWLNLEYLSAEPWVEDFHGCPSPVHGMQKTFFFPGFSVKTGGLLWDEALLALPQQEQTVAARTALFTTLGLDTALADIPLHISLFAYENPELPQLLDALAVHSQKVHLLVPKGRISAGVEAWLKEPLTLGQSQTRGQLTLSAVPFMAQPTYDRLLASCQLNFVRGEESFVRAQMLGLPLVWHIYQQSDNAHLVKLKAFLDLYLREARPEFSEMVRQTFQAWNQPGVKADWQAFLALLPELAQQASAWQQRQKNHGNLAQNLVKFAQTSYSAAHF